MSRFGGLWVWDAADCCCVIECAALANHVHGR